MSFRSSRLLFAFGLSVLVLGTVIGAFFITGSPTRQRLLRHDQQRSMDLLQIRSMVEDYRNQAAHKQTPESLEALRRDPPFSQSAPYQNWIDPVTKQPYEYRRISDSSYQLCAVFELDTQAEPLNSYSSDFNHHPQGYYCFLVNGSAPLSPSPLPVLPS